jgi:hypothetical protein
LGRLLTGTEARAAADRIADGDPLRTALHSVAQPKRARARELLDRIGGGPGVWIPVLAAIAGARSDPGSITPVWTMPGPLAQSGRLTATAADLVRGARQSVTCSTFNFQRSSAMWDALGEAAQRPGVAVRVYIDAAAAANSSPSAGDIARHLRGATVLRTKRFDGAPVRNHAKLLVIDHRLLLVTSANLSFSAERLNIEYGQLTDNPALAEAAERALRDVEDRLYEPVSPAPG